MRKCILALAALFAIIGIGCQTSTPAASAAISSPQRAVVVSGGNGSTAVFVPTADPGNPMFLCSGNLEVCPECKAAAIKYFDTGVLDPKCTRTGATRTAVIPNTPSVSHN